jgi:flavin reductase (DIM6/NTAB) family NADH-FMN oxidoreductase RutF
MVYDFSRTEAPRRYKLMSHTIVPRPIAWIVTEGASSLNVAPFSFFSGVSSNPPSVMVAIGHKSDGSPKDTLYNIRTTKKCVICSVTLDALEKMHFSSAELGTEIDESKHYDIETVKLLDDYPPMVKGAPTALFCTLLQETFIKGSKTIPVFLQIDHMYLDDSYVDENGQFELDLVARVGKSYAALGEQIPVPEIPK